MAQNAAGDRFEAVMGAAVETALAEAKAGQAEPYYDEPADRIARERYYDGIDAGDGEAQRAALAERLEQAHDPRPAYKPMLLVYPRVDLHPDGLLRSIYSGKTFSAEELIQADAGIERARTERLVDFTLNEVALGPSELWASLDSTQRSNRLRARRLLDAAVNGAYGLDRPADWAFDRYAGPIRLRGATTHPT
jgi:hypothetical protein